MIERDLYTKWLTEETSGVYGGKLLTEMNEIIRLYGLYDGAGQNWPTDNSDYTPTKVITNFVKKLINDESRFMTGRAPEITISPLNPDQDKQAEQIQDWVMQSLSSNQWRKRLIRGVRDAFIGKRIALKVTLPADKSTYPVIRFSPSLEFVYFTETDADVISKIIFFYSVTDDKVTDRTKQRIWKQKYAFEGGKCLLWEGLYDGYGIPVSMTHNGENTGLPYIPAHVVINGGLSGDLSGDSDVAELIGNQDAYNRMKSDDIDAMRYNMFPQHVFTDASQECMDKVVVAPNALIDLQSDESSGGKQASAAVLESSFAYDQRLQNAMERFKDDMHELLSVPRTSPEQLKSVTSGKAMRAMYWSLICRCEEKWADGWDDALEWLTRTLVDIGQRTAGLPMLDGYTVKIDHLYPIIDDEEEERERDLREVAQQARSRRSYVEKWNQAEDPDKELNRISSEKRLLEDSFEELM